VSERAFLQVNGLTRRTSPTQRRARERIERILAAAQTLLATMPLEAITTSAIAAEAGVPVSSIYRYFPNVQAIFKEMFEELVGELHRRVAAISDDTARWPSWRMRHFQVMQAMRSVLNDHPAYRPLFQLMLSTRELRAVKQRANEMIAAHLGARWRRGEDGFHGGDPDLVARMATEIFTSFEALASEADPAFSDKLFAETAIALESYLSIYLASDC
jgi:AcrR family transcriptional regulator